MKATREARISGLRRWLLAPALAGVMLLAACAPETPLEDTLGTPAADLTPQITAEEPGIIGTDTGTALPTEEPVVESTAIATLEEPAVTAEEPGIIGTDTGTALPTEEPVVESTAIGTMEAAGTQPPAGMPEGTPMATPIAEGQRLFATVQDLMGMQVMNAEGEAVGEITELLVDAEGNLEHVVLSLPTPAEAGATERQVIVNFDENIRTDVEQGQLIYTGTQEALDAADEFRLTGRAADAFVVQTQGTDIPQQYEGLIRLNRLVGQDLTGMLAEQAGVQAPFLDIERILVDLRDGQTAYAILGMGGLMGQAESLVAVPWNQFTFDTQAVTEGDLSSVLDLGVNLETLQNAPTVTLEDLPTWPQPVPDEWDLQIRNFWQDVG